MEDENPNKKRSKIKFVRPAKKFLPKQEKWQQKHLLADFNLLSWATTRQKPPT